MVTSQTIAATPLGKDPAKRKSMAGGANVAPLSCTDDAAVAFVLREN